MLSAFGSDGADGEDVDGDGTVNVNGAHPPLSPFVHSARPLIDL